MGTGSYNGEISKMSAKDRLSSANSQKSLPDLSGGRIGGLKSARFGAMTSEERKVDSLVPVPLSAKNKTSGSRLSLTSLKK